MRFKFQLKQKSCCGGGNSTTLTSANYNLAPENINAAFVRALDSFNTNYHTTPTEILVTQSELTLMQQQLIASEFSINKGRLHYRKIPISVQE